MIDIGDPLPDLAVTVYNAAGTPADATAVVLTVTLPDGTTATPSITHTPGTGVYTVAGYLATLPGRYLIHWEATGTNACTHNDVRDVEGADISIVSLSSVKTQLAITTATHDEELRDYISSASENIDNTCGPCAVRTVTERVSSGGWACALWLTEPPIVSLTSVTQVFTTSSALTTANLTTDLVSGKVSRLDGGSIYGTYDVVYKAGRVIIPSSIRLACMMIVQHFWDTRRGPATSRRRGEGDLITMPGWGYAIPNRAAELLSGYATPMLLA